MGDVTYKLYGLAPGNAVTNSLATIDIQDDGMLEGILLSLVPSGMDALDDEVRMEVSFGSTNSFNVNDSRISIVEVGVVQQFLTSGGGVLGVNVYVPVDLKLTAGERIHLHTTTFAGNAARCTAYLYCTARGGSRRTARRRR